MRRAGSEGWQIGVDFDRHAATMLYIRDAAGLAAPADYGVPRLAPRVSLDARLATHATTGAADQWGQWWEQHLDMLRMAERGLLGPLPAAPPDPGTDLRSLYEAVADEALAWVKARHAEYTGRTISPSTRHVRAQGEDTVRRIERELGRESAPFRLRVRVLPLERKWGRRVDGGVAVVSEQLWLDGYAYDLFLDPIVRSLA